MSSDRSLCAVHRWRISDKLETSFALRDSFLALQCSKHSRLCKPPSEGFPGCMIAAKLSYELLETSMYHNTLLWNGRVIERKRIRFKKLRFGGFSPCQRAQLFAGVSSVWQHRWWMLPLHWNDVNTIMLGQEWVDRRATSGFDTIVSKHHYSSQGREKTTHQHQHPLSIHNDQVSLAHMLFPSCTNFDWRP